MSFITAFVTAPVVLPILPFIPVVLSNATPQGFVKATRLHNNAMRQVHTLCGQDGDLRKQKGNRTREDLTGLKGATTTIAFPSPCPTNPQVHQRKGVRSA